MQPHLHTGVVSVIFAGLAAILIINATRIIAARATDSNSPTLQAVGKTVGGIVTFA